VERPRWRRSTGPRPARPPDHRLVAQEHQPRTVPIQASSVRFVPTLPLHVYYPWMHEAAVEESDRLDQVIGDLFRLSRPQGPPFSWAGSDLTVGQLRLLFRLRHDGPLTMGAVARIAGCSLQSASALIERVERRGLVERRHIEDDRRIVVCQLTDPGRSLVEEMAGDRAQALRDALSVLDAEELALLHRLVLTIVERKRHADAQDSPEMMPDRSAPAADAAPASAAVPATATATVSDRRSVAVTTRAVRTATDTPTAADRT
jgi:DNA-binding MarR family transcriptional regulator